MLTLSPVLRICCSPLSSLTIHPIYLQRYTLSIPIRHSCSHLPSTAPSLPPFPFLSSISTPTIPTSECDSHPDSDSISHTKYDSQSNCYCNCYNEGVEDVSMMTGEEVNAYDAYLVFLNGLIVGVHTKPTELVEKGECYICNMLLSVYLS